MRDKLKQYKKKIELKLEKERELAKELVKSGQIEFEPYILLALPKLSNLIFV